MSTYGYERQVDQLVLEVPEMMGAVEEARDRNGEINAYVLVMWFGSWVDQILGAPRDRWAEQAVPITLVGDEGLIRRCMSVIEEWAKDDTPGVQTLLATGFFESFDDAGIERLVPHLGPAAWAVLRPTMAGFFDARPGLRPR